MVIKTTATLNANFSLCIPFILGTLSVSVFSTIGHKERKELGKQFERMTFERETFERMTGEQIQ